MNVQSEIDMLNRQIVTRQQQIAWLEKHRLLLLALPEGHVFELIGAYVDFDRLSHAQVIEVIKAFGGKWEKKVSTGGLDRIDYTTTFDGFTVRCYAGEPPPACKIIEVEEFVPASVQKVRKLVCPDSMLNGEPETQATEAPAIEAQSV